MEDTSTSITDDPVAKPKPSLSTVYGELSKIRLSLMVVITTGAGFVMASPLGIDWLTLLWTLIGTTACAGSAAALNQLAEGKRDALMNRTVNRPLPAGHISKAHAFIFGILLAYIGIGILSFGANITAAGIAPADNFNLRLGLHPAETNYFTQYPRWCNCWWFATTHWLGCCKRWN